MTLLELSFSGAVFIFAIVVFRTLAFHRLPKGTFVALWWLAALRLLVPVKLASRFSVRTLLEAMRPQEFPVIPANPVLPVAPPALIVPDVKSVVPAAPTSAPFPVWEILWITGAVVLGLWFLVRYVCWRRRFRESFPAAGCLELDAGFHRKIRLRVTDQIIAPLTYGLFHPVILLPKSMDLDDKEALTCVLAHERAHIRRLDGLLKLVLSAALCLHWFNPTVWLLYILGNRDMEIRCDEAAVLALGEDSRERYALALIRLAAGARQEEKQYVPLCGFVHRNGMEERIKAIMRVKKKSLLACFIALALVMGITTAFATSAKPAKTAPAEDREDKIDHELYARASSESAAQWEEVLAPYEPFGLSWTFEDPDLDGNGLTMAFEGREVMGIYDEKRGIWITEHAGNGTYGPDAAEIFTVYENGELAGLRFATEAEQARFTQDREASSDALRVMTLADSVRYEGGCIYFTIPESENPWSIFIQGRILTEDVSGISVHYLEEESERAEWVPGATYSFKVADAAYDELTMEVRYGNADYCYPLTLLLPEGGEPLPGLPEGKADIPEGVSMIWPVESTQVINPFGDRTKPGGEGVVTHSGVDIGGMAEGTPIFAAAAGTVKEAGFSARQGNYVRLDHGNGLETFYAHCRSVTVKTGDAVDLGQTIASVGSTGQSTGPHLHFEILRDGVLQNPETFYQMNGVPAGLGASQPEPAAAPAQPKAAEPPEPVGPEGAEPEEARRQRAQLVDGGYPKNSRGETYGNAFGYRLTGYDPDLLSVVGTNGERGYISTKESNITAADSPEEAAAYTNWVEENHVTGYTIPLYDKDHNVIGEFQVGESGPGSKTLEEIKEAKAQGWPNENGSKVIEQEPKFKSIEEAKAAAEADGAGDLYEGYYAQ